jgi:hypothetical protein
MTSNALALAQKVSVLTSSSGASTTTYANTTDLPTSGVTTGAMAYVSANNKLYMWNGTAWFNIAIVNQAPTAITGNLATYVLATDGTPTVVTLVSTDPEGLPLTWSSSTSGDTQVGTFSLTDNVFTITPSTDEADIGTLSVTFSVTDGNNTETSVSSFTLGFLSPYWNETVLSIGTSSTNGLANSTFIDRSTNAHTVTPVGTPVQTAFHPYLDNWSANFTGDGSYLSIPTDSDFHFDTGDYTVECWVNPTDVSGMFWIGGIWSYTIPWYQAWGFYMENGKWKHVIDPADTVINISTSNAVAQVWTHLAIVRSGDAFKLFVNGVLESDVTSAGYNMQEGDGFVGIGAVHATPSGASMRGQIADFHVIKGYAKYTSAFTPPTEPIIPHANTVLLTCRRNRFYDESTTNKTITVNGSNASVSALSPFGQGSEYAVGENKGSVFSSGDSSYLNVSGGSWLTLDGDFDISFWYYSIDLTTERNILISTYHSPTDGWMLETNITGEIRLALTGDGTDLTTTSCLVAHNWHHIRFSRNSGVVKVHVDGVEVGSVSNSGTFTYSNTFVIGNLGPNRSPYNNIDGQEGYISDLVFKQSAPASYNVPTAPVGNTNASLYLPMDNAGIFDKTGNNTLTPVGNASTSTTQTKFADTAMYFDGSGDFIKFNEPNFSNNNFTFEFWIYRDGIQTVSDRVYQSRDGDVYVSIGVSFYNATDIVVSLSSNGSSWDINESSLKTSLADQTWEHIAIVRSGSTISLYKNGLLVISITSTAALYYSGETATIGGQTTGRNFTGYLENFQILKGVAKYTANFTVPNRTQGRGYQQT